MRVRLIFLGLMIACPLLLPSAAKSMPLIEELGCGNCHNGIKNRSEIKNITPILDQAGIRYKAFYLYDYLQNPREIRPQIGAVRMPQYNFSRKEAVALVRYFRANAYPIGSELGSLLFHVKKLVTQKDVKEGQQLIKSMCASCHSGKNRIAVSLTNIADRLEQDWVTVMLIDPERLLGHRRMTAQFYEKKQTSDKSYHKIRQDSVNELAAVVRALFPPAAVTKLGKSQAAKIQEWEQANAEYPQVTATSGRSLFLSQNCMACHKARNEKIRNQRLAPSLSFEGLKVRKKWLKSYLKNPDVIHPFGYKLGSGSRMPNFNFKASELKEISNALMQMQSLTIGLEPIKIKRKGSVFFQNKILHQLNSRCSEI